MNAIDIDDLLQRPLVQTVLLPAILALAAAAAARLVDRKGEGPGCRGALAAGVAPTAAFIAAYCVIAGVPSAPPIGAGQKIPYIALFGAVIGFAADWSRVNQGGRRLFAVIGVIATVGWIALPRLESGEFGPLVISIGVAVGGWIAIMRLNRLAENGAAPSVMLIAAALGSAFVALYGASGLLAQLCVALAAAILGYLALNWPRPRYRFGAAMLFGCGLSLVALIATMALYSATAMHPSPLPFLVLVFFVDSALDRMRISPQFGGQWRDNALGPIILLILALIPAAAAAFVASIVTPGFYFG